MHVLGFTWHLIPAMLQAQVSGSQKTRQSQPQSSLDIRIALSSCFSSTSIFFTPEERSSALRFLVVRGCRKKYSSTSVLSRSMSSSEMSSAVSVLASSDSTVPFLVSWIQEGNTFLQGTKSFRPLKFLLLASVKRRYVMQSFTDYLPWVWLSWVSPPSGDLGACLCGSSPAPGQIHPVSTAWSSCACWTCPACCLPGWARWWSPAAGWSSTLSHSQNAPFVSSGASLSSRLSQLQREKREPWHVNSFSSHVTLVVHSFDNSLVHCGKN